MRSFAKIYSRVGSVATIIAFFSLYYIFLIGYCLWIQMLLINECWSWIQQLDKTLLFVLFIYFLRYLQIITILVFFFSHFTHCTLFVLLFCVITLARASRTMLNRSGNNDYSWLFADFKPMLLKLNHYLLLGHWSGLAVHCQIKDIFFYS